MKSKATKPLFTLDGPLPVKVYRGKFKPFASTEFINVRALKSVDKVLLECGTLEVAGKSITLVADVRKGVIHEIRPEACAGCSPHKAKQKAAVKQLKATVQAVNAELARRKTAQPDWPVGAPIQARLGFRIPLGPIIIIIGTDPDEGIDTFDICIVINIGNVSCIFCLFAPNACVRMGPPL